MSSIISSDTRRESVAFQRSVRAISCCGSTRFTWTPPQPVRPAMASAPVNSTALLKAVVLFILFSIIQHLFICGFQRQQLGLFFLLGLHGSQSSRLAGQTRLSCPGHSLR